jgi:hypothetical protein
VVVESVLSMIGKGNADGYRDESGSVGLRVAKLPPLAPGEAGLRRPLCPHSRPVLHSLSLGSLWMRVCLPLSALAGQKKES